MNCPFTSKGSYALNPPANCPYLGGQGGGVNVNNPVAEHEEWQAREDFRKLVRSLNAILDNPASSGERFIKELERLIDNHAVTEKTGASAQDTDTPEKSEKSNLEQANEVLSFIIEKGFNEDAVAYLLYCAVIGPPTTPM